MRILICAGGSAIRTLEAVLHLCAAGLGPPELTVMVIDPDKANGNYKRVRGLLDTYVDCQKVFGGRLGTGLKLFDTKLDLLDTQVGDQGLKVWTPVQPNDTLKRLLNYDNLQGNTRTNRDVVHLFFSEAELKEKLGQGFRGHPAIGAAALSLLPHHMDASPWSQLIGKMKNAIQKQDGVRVCIAGSVFGGTGASAIYPVARFIRTVPQTAADRLKIGVVALVPYFQFVPGAAVGNAPVAVAQDQDLTQLAAKSEGFALATRSAVEFYDHLRKNDGDQWPLDAMYWVGDSDGMEVPYCPGGPDQTNPAHFVDFLAATAALEFLQLPAHRLSKPIGCVCAGPRQDVEPPARNKNLLDWPDIPLMHFERVAVTNALLRFFLAGAVHLGFGMPLLEYNKGEVDIRSYCVPWYFRRFARHSLRSAADLDQLKKLAQFFRSYHFPWWLQMLSVDDTSRVRLFNRGALRRESNGTVDVKLECLADLLWGGDEGTPTAEPMDCFFTEMVKVRDDLGGEEGSPSYLALLAHAANRYIKREYSDVVVPEA